MKFQKQTIHLVTIYIAWMKRWDVKKYGLGCFFFFLKGIEGSKGGAITCKWISTVTSGIPISKPGRNQQLVDYEFVDNPDKNS